MNGMKGKVAVVTGSSRGIGRAIAMKLADHGVNLVVNFFRNRKAADETAALIEERGVRCLVVKANVAQDEHVVEMFQQVRERFGRVDFLVSNAASGVLKPAMELTHRHWDWTMHINAHALLVLSQQAAPMMASGSRILAISSLGSMRAMDHYAAVGASKAALESLVRHLAAELGPQGITVNTISAGVVDTDALKHFPNRDEMLRNALDRTPIGRLITPDDVADAALFLCSSHSSGINGQTLVVDGGYSINA